jgi:hypothetical protein
LAEQSIPEIPKTSTVQPEKGIPSETSGDPVAEVIKAFENPSDIERLAPQPDLPAGQSDPRLIKYIETAVGHGQKIEDIRKDLLKAGHNPDKVERHIGYASERQTKVWRQKWFQVLLILCSVIICAVCVYGYYISVS